MLLDSVTKWVEQPFSEQMDLLHWALFILFIIVLIILWNDSLRIITKVID